jgi:hypothetical protein
MTGSILPNYIVIINILDLLYFRYKFFYFVLVGNILVIIFINTGATGDSTCFGSPRLAYYIS